MPANITLFQFLHRTDLFTLYQIILGTIFVKESILIRIIFNRFWICAKIARNIMDSCEYASSVFLERQNYEKIYVMEIKTISDRSDSISVSTGLVFQQERYQGNIVLDNIFVFNAIVSLTTFILTRYFKPILIFLPSVLSLYKERVSVFFSFNSM